MKNVIPLSTGRAPSTPAAKVIAITSGKGGVGKTNITCNLGIELARRGARVCIFDADTGLANIAIVMGMNPSYTIEQVLQGEKTIDEIAVQGPQGVTVIPAASGVAACADLDEGQRQRLISALEQLEERCDYILIDTAAGIGRDVLAFVQSAQHAIVVISPEPTSLTDAFALIRVLKRQGYDRPLYVLVNMVVNYPSSMEVFKRFEAAVKKYLHARVHYLGYISQDEHIRASVGAQRPVILYEPDAHASRCFRTLAEVLGQQLQSAAPRRGFSGYWKALRPTGPAPRERTAANPEARLNAASEAFLSALGDARTDESAAGAELVRLIHAYAARFRRMPPGIPAVPPPPSERPAGGDAQVLAELRGIVARIADEEHRLQESLDAMADCVGQLVAAGQELRAARAEAQDDDEAASGGDSEAPNPEAADGP